MTAGTDALKNAFRDYQTAGVPATGPNEPDKGEIRGGFDVLGGELSSLVGEVDTVSARVNALAGAQSAGAIGTETLAELEAITDQPDGTIGRVFDDPSPANNGDYIWNGAAWSQVATDRITKAEDAASTVVNLRYPMVYDKDNVLGGGSESLYVARGLYAKRGATVLNGTYGTASAEISTHIKLAVQNNLSTVYIDLTDGTNPVKVALFPTLAPVGTNYIILATLRSGQVNSEIAVEYADEGLKGRVSVRNPIAVDGDKLLVPQYVAYRRRSGFVSVAPADGSYYFEFDLPTSSSNERRVYHNWLTGLPASALDSAYPTYPEQGEYITRIATLRNRTVETDKPRHREVGSLFLRGNDPDRALLYSSNATLADVTDANLTALGITRGATGTEAFYGEDLPGDLPLKGSYFARIYVQASADDTFQTPRLYVIDSQGNSLGFANMILEKRFSARAASYIIFGQYSYTKRPAYFNVGTFQSSNQVIVGGAQVYFGTALTPWVRRAVWPASPCNDLTYGPDMYLVDGRVLPLYPDNLFGSRSPSAIISIASPKALPEIDFDTQAQGGCVLLDPADLGATVSLTAISGGAERSAIKRRSVAVSSVATPLAGSPSIMLLGDSITNRQTGWGVKTLLEDWGLTPTWIGTIPGADTTATLSTGGPLGEGREGWATTDFIGSEIGDATNGVLAVGNEAAYNAATKDNKTKYQPFLNPTLGAGSAAPIVNIGGTDYRFDMRFYLDRFSLADPDIVAINLGMNDLLEDYDDMLATVSTNLPIIVTEIRRALPSTKILLWSTTVPYGQYGDGRQAEGWSAIQRSMIELVETGGDANVHVCSAWAHQSPLAGWSQLGSDDDAGVINGRWSDVTHPTGTARWQHVEALACAMANLA